MTTVIIGSGPAGVAAAKAFADSGCRTVLLDAGDRIEPGRMDVFDALARSEPEHWPPQLLDRARAGFSVGIRHVPLKPAYGSLFPYAVADPDLPIEAENAETWPSLAYGGLSNAWGAALLPFRQQDVDDWPISLRELAPSYEAVLRFVPFAAQHDDLAETFPLYVDSPTSLRREPQAEMLLRGLRRNSNRLRDSGFTFGASRLAVVAAAEHPRRCRHSGMCLHGCPYGAIYNASQTLETLIRDARVDYRGGVYVDRLTETGRSVRIDFHERRHSRRSGSMTASRVFVACGSISSTRLMLDSMGHTHFRRTLHDSQYFVVPMLSRHAVPVGAARQGNTLAQVFIELDEPAISRHTVHLQVYGYNDLVLRPLAKLPLRATTLERTLSLVLGRLFIVQGYLHSADSPGLSVRRDGGEIRLVGEDGTLGAARVRKLVRRLAAAAPLLGMVPLPGLTQIGRPGKSNHIGGSFPMRAEAGPLETDRLGRLRDWQRVHLVDGAIFPSVPATTVTISVMANAYRIAAALATGAASQT